MHIHVHIVPVWHMYVGGKIGSLTLSKLCHEACVFRKVAFHIRSMVCAFVGSRRFKVMTTTATCVRVF